MELYAFDLMCFDLKPLKIKEEYGQLLSNYDKCVVKYVH